MDQQPNILLIVSDQHSPHFLGCAGEPLVRTPNLDALAARGVRFSDTSCGNPLCVPSRMTMLTGRHSSDIDVWSNGCVLGSQIPTFAHHLTAAGYETVLCGRMHFVGSDQRHGYEQRILGDVHAHLEHIPRASCGQTAAGIVGCSGPGRTAYSAYDDAVTAAARQYLLDHDRRGLDRPLFLTVGYVLPHCPYIAPKRLYDGYREQVEMPRVPQHTRDHLHPALRAWREHRGVDTIPEDDALAARAAYYGLVTYTDELIGQLLDTLAQTSYGDDTVVIYLSDHGEMAGEQGMWWKSSFYQGSVGVPLIAAWPGQFAQGETVDAVTSLLDVGPTLLDIAGGEPMNHVRGRSLRPFLTGETPADWSDTCLAEYAGLQGDPPARMIRRGPWKLVHHHGYEQPQLFNLADDPHEWHDLRDDPAHADLRDELHAAALEGWSAERILEGVPRNDADRAVLRRFEQARQPSPGDSPDRWTAPDGVNVFPEA